MSEGSPASHDNVTNLPAQRAAEVATPSALPAVTAPPSPPEWRALKEQAQVIVASGMAPRSVRNANQVLVIALKGRELALPPMQALSHIHIVEGKPTLSAELMAALVQRAGHKLRVVETTPEKCAVVGIRRDDPGFEHRVEFTMDDARRASVAGKGPWRSYPQAMLRARAISALCRFAFADVLMGASYTPEELGAEVDEEGQVLATETGEPPATPRRSEPRNDEPEEVVEGEVVEDDVGEPVAGAPPGDILKSQIGRIEDLSRRIWGEKRAVEQKVLKGHRIEELDQDRAKSVISGLQKTKERIEAQESGGGSQRSYDDGSTAEAAEAEPAEPGTIRDEQYERLVAILDEVFPDEDDEGASGHQRYEKEYLAKPLPALTEAQADEVLGWAEEQLAKARAEASGGREKPKGELPATKKQLNYLEALIVDVVEDGVGRFEEMVGKPMGDLTREEASEWINRLSGRQG